MWRIIPSSLFKVSLYCGDDPGLEETSSEDGEKCLSADETSYGMVVLG